MPLPVSQFSRAFVLGLSVGVAALASGCGTSLIDSSSSGTLAITGNIHGGRQAVSGSNIVLYAAGTAGNGSPAVSVLKSGVTVTSDQFGFFSLTGHYTCTNSTDQIYITATGGDPGNGTSNASLAMMAALGNCGDLLSAGANRFVLINELTTVAAAWALAPFMTGPTSLGRSSTNAVGLQNAFLDAALLVDTNTGTIATSTIGLTIESGKVAALADAIASCVNNTSGGTNCIDLFSAAKSSSGSTPSDTLTAALNIVKNPGANVGSIWNLVGSTPPFPTSLTQAPHDWTMSVTIPLAQGTSTAKPSALDVDSTGIVWVAGEGGVLNGVKPQGALVNATGFGVGALQQSGGLAIDTAGYVWVTNLNSTPNTKGSVSKFQGGSLSSPGAIIPGNGGTNFYDSSLDEPYDISADTSGDVFIGNYGSGGSPSATEYSTTTNAPVATGLGSGSADFVEGIASDGQGGVWLANTEVTYATHVLANGTVSNVANCCFFAAGVAIDPAGNAWIANYGNSTVSAISSAGTLLVNQSSAGGLNGPSRLSVDAGGTVWLPNVEGGSFSALSSGTVSGEPAIGTAISPATGFGLDSGLQRPFGIVPDRSGNLWVADFGNNDVVMYFGLATPTVTPKRPHPTAP